MSVNNRIEYTIKIKPIEILTDENAGTHDILASEIGTRFSISNSVVVGLYDDTAAIQGYKDAIVNYLEAIDSADTTDISSKATACFVMIKNTGYTFSSATGLGVALSAAIKVMVATTVIAILQPGEAIVLHDVSATINCTGIHVRTVTTAGAEGSPGHLAVERLVVG